ncbi:enoyl-CoA hydratase/isomerase family protein [uncultured Serinicoccus sp.]|uniref:enoyl-CoA hydratase/isomerase family protein n=1 Tax=uncultured Serinicoccus sp. TaxID=735514 RepID=UPI0026367080|nr:enoyl-CoA hydratase/isomerase family protein [uncultured Serinicoccus sp.]
MTTGQTRESVVVSRDEDRVGTITLNRPEVLNALDSAAHRVFAAAVRELEADEDIGAIVVRGAGRAFCSGSDLREIGELSGRAEQEYVALDFATKNLVAGCAVPVVAALHGWCVGGGLELALACTIRIAAQDATFALPEVSLGSLPGSGGLQRLAPVVGLGVATDWILTGRTVDASEALARGLVTRVVADEELDRAAHSLAAELATRNSLALRLAMVALRPEPLSERGLVAAFQALAGDATHRDPRYAAATRPFRGDQEPVDGSRAAPPDGRQR